MPLVLFLCSGNYYRSRFAEHLFNALAERATSVWRAESRGFHLSATNQGPISQQSLRELAARHIFVPEPLRWPKVVAADDFARAAHVVAVKEAEHRPEMEKRFPEWLHRVEFWHIHDQDQAPPTMALPELAAAVEQLAARLMREHSPA